MQYRQFGKLDFKVSALGFGVMRMPLAAGAVDEAESIRMIRTAIDRGVNYLDSAYFYHDGQSEIIVGKALADGYRDKVRVATKLPSWNVNKKADFDRYFDEQLRRLAVDHIDFYLLHTLNTKTWAKLRDLGILEWADKAMASGRFKHFGFSFHDELKVFKEIIDAYNWSMCLIQYNYMDVANQAGWEGLRYAAAKEIAVAVMEPLLGGNLASWPPSVQAIWEKASTKRTPVEWALQWLWDQPEVSTVLSGMSTMEQVLENTAYASASGTGKLTPEELALFEEVRSLHETLTVIPCSGCGYCKPCPNHVDIPENIGIYNNAKKFNQLEASRRKYNFWKKAYELHKSYPEDIRAVSCTSCGECEEKCPQNIPISRWMPVIHEVLEKNKPLVTRLDD